MKEGKKIGLLGGGFDPIHLGHMAIAKNALKEAGLDGVYFIPAYHSPFKEDRPHVSDEERLRMLRIALEPYPQFEYLDWEIERGKVSYTIDTVRELVYQWPEVRFCWIIGGDLVQSLDKWKEAEKLVNMVEFIVVDRPGYHYDPPKNKFKHLNIKRIKGERLSISSTEIRKRLKVGESVEGELDEGVHNYITINRLYQ